MHGVSGTPPEDVLCSQWVGQVAGDENARIFQPADQFGRPGVLTRGTVSGSALMPCRSVIWAAGTCSGQRPMGGAASVTNCSCSLTSAMAAASGLSQRAGRVVQQREILIMV